MVREYGLVLALFLAAPGGALAQSDAPPEPSTPEDGDEEATPPPAAPAPAAPGTDKDKEEDDQLPKAGDTTPRDFGGAFQPGELGGKSDEHTVERGDTLWDLSGKFMGNPWYWPKVWSYNPEIENPHWIYPGDEVRFYPASDVEEGEQIQEELADVSKGGWDAPTYMTEEDDVTVAGQIGFAGTRHLLARHDGFVTDRELAEAGTIAMSWEEHQQLVEGDRIYISWKDRSQVKIGERYVVFRSGREVEHPDTGEPIGYLTQILGSVKVVDLSSELIIGVIERSFSEMQRGDYIGPVAGAFARSVGPKPNAKSAKGVICATIEPDAGVVSQWTLVFLDIGKNRGLEEGNTLDIVRASDGLEEKVPDEFYDYTPPTETLGRLLVLDSKDSTAAALVVKSIREVRIGDRVQMVAAAP